MSNKRFFTSNRKGETHSFNINIAFHYSIEKAIIIQDLLSFCTQKMRTNKLKHNLPLVYYSSNALQEKYNYMKSKSIARWLKELESDGILFSTIANKIKYDRTKSYLINFEKYDIFSNSMTDVKWNTQFDLEFKKYCKNAVEQNEKTISQNEKSKTQNEESISQNDTTIPNQTTNQTTNHISTKIEKSEILENDYIDFNELQKQNKKIGISGQIKAIVQSELNYLTFDSFDNKIIDRMIKSIISNLTAFKRKKKDFTKTTNEDIVEAFKTALNSIKSKSGETPTLSYVNSCLNPNLYIKELQQQNNETDSELEEFKAIVKKIFSHYHRFTKSDLKNLKTIIKAIEESGSKDVLFDFKFIMNNLPAYILESISLQSISYLANKINDLLRTCSLEAKIRSHERFVLISQSFGEKKAYEILTKTLTKNL